MAGALDDDKVLNGGGDEGNVGVATYLPIDVLGDDETGATPREGKVYTRGTHSSDVVAFKVFRDKKLVLASPMAISLLNLTHTALTSVSDFLSRGMQTPVVLKAVFWPGRRA